MNMHVAYHDWTYQQVRGRIIEAADTARSLPRHGHKKITRAAWPEYVGLYAPDMRVRCVPSAGALSRMEEAWSWVNTFLDEADRRIIHDYADTKSAKGKTITALCEKNGWIKDKFEAAVRHACQQIADNLNRKHEVRLTISLDENWQNLAHEDEQQVGSAPPRSPTYLRTDDAVPTHDRSEAAKRADAEHIKRVSEQRRGEAERQRKAALRRKEEAAQLAAKIAEREARKRKQARAA
jgi:hypothetical protein